MECIKIDNLRSFLVYLLLLFEWPFNVCVTKDHAYALRDYRTMTLIFNGDRCLLHSGARKITFQILPFFAINLIFITCYVTGQQQQGSLDRLHPSGSVAGLRGQRAHRGQHNRLHARVYREVCQQPLPDQLHGNWLEQHALYSCTITVFSNRVVPSTGQL